MSQQVSGESFLAVVTKSGLVEPPRLNQLVEGFAEEGGDRDDSQALAEYLIARNAVTRWQAEKLLQGKHKGYFLGKYRLLSLLGRGGMSSVYLAEHVLMRRRCAIKVLPAKRVGDSSYLGRFHREAQAVASLDHPNIVRAYDVDHQSDRDTDIHFLVMEYVEGSSLQELVAREGVVPFADAVEYVRHAALGLAHAHQAGLVHRDIKPANLLVDKQGTVKILDLGLARFFNGSEEEQALTIQHDEKVLGTADYLAPEQALDSHTVDARADIYSLGCTLYFLLTGSPPFTEGTLTQRLMAHQTKEPPSVTEKRPDVPASLEALLKRMMAKKPDERFANATETANALLEWLDANADSNWRKAHSGIFSELPNRGPRRATPVAARVVSPATKTAPVVAKAVNKVPPATAAPATSTTIPSETTPPVEPEPLSAAAHEPELAAFFAGMGGAAPTTTSPPPNLPAEGSAATPSPGLDSLHTGTGSSKIRGKSGTSSVKQRVPAASSPKLPAAPSSKNLPADSSPPETPTVVPNEPAASEVVEEPAPATPASGPDFSFLNSPAPVPDFNFAASEGVEEPPSAWPTINTNPPPPSAPVESPEEQIDGAADDLPDDLEPELVSEEPEAEAVAEATESATTPSAPETVASEQEFQPEFTFPNSNSPAIEVPVVSDTPFSSGGFGIDAGAASVSSRTSRVSARKGTTTKTPARAGGSRKGVPKSWVLLGGGGIVALVGVLLAGSLLGWFESKQPDQGAGKSKKTTEAKVDDGDKPVAANSGKSQGASPVSSSAWSDKREATVGAGGDFPTISAALQQISKSFSSGNRSDRFVLTVAAGTYADRFAIDGKNWNDRGSGVNVIIRGTGEVILQPQGADPVIKLQNAIGVQLHNLTIRANGQPIAVELAESLDRTLLKDLRIDGFSETGILLNGALGPSFTTDRVILENIRLQGQPSAVAIRGHKGRLSDSVDCQNIFLNRCRCLGPLAAGVSISGADVRGWEFRECIFSQAQVGIEIVPPVGWSDFMLVNNTFYQCGIGVRVAQQPPTSSKGISLRRNLFVGTGQAEVLIGENFDEMKLTQNQMLGLMQGNWTDRAAPATPASGELTIWANGERGKTDIAFESTDPGSNRFLAPGANAPQRNVGGGPAGTSPWIGAVGP